MAEKRAEVDDRAFLSVFTGCDVTDGGNLEEVLDEVVGHSRERIAVLNSLREKVAAYEKALAESQNPEDEDVSSD
jgi:hypothetical protein